jgi:hypothetical protein
MKAADRIIRLSTTPAVETLLQARDYQAQGYDTSPWQETSIGALRTDSDKLRESSADTRERNVTQLTLMIDREWPLLTKQRFLQLSAIVLRIRFASSRGRSSPLL